jgi:outer membrane receptor protein involved in Fe transport
VVGAANVLYALTDRISLVGSVGRAFRSPNLIEWFFEGPTPEGNGFQLRSPELKAETSFDVDLGARYRDHRLSLEAFVFRNEIRDGVRIARADTTIDGLPGFRNVNVDELLYRGVELSGDLALAYGFGVDAGYAKLDSENTLDPSNPVGESFSTKLTGGIRYDDPRGRFNVRWWVRHQGEQKEVDLGTNPVGDVLPAFTVHSAAASITLFAGTGHVQRLALTVRNLGDVLYSETSNASFFRPEPGRRATLSWEARF